MVLAILLTATNMVVLATKPVAGGPPGADLAIAAFLRLTGLLLLSVLLLRRATASPRPGLMPDGAFWLYAALWLIGFVIVIGLRFVVPGDAASLGTLVAGNALAGLLTAPFAPWLTAVAVERPLAISPGPWLRRFGGWLPALIIWQLFLLDPLGALHGYLDLGLLKGDIVPSLSLEILDGMLSALIVLVTLALAVTAYTRVAKD